MIEEAQLTIAIIMAFSFFWAFVMKRVEYVAKNEFGDKKISYWSGVLVACFTIIFLLSTIFLFVSYLWYIWA